MDKSKFWVIAVISNPVRFKSRYQLYKEFEQRMLFYGVNLLTVEIAFGDRPFEITQPNSPNYVQLRTKDELWHKENMINIGISKLPSNWEYVAWIDADVSFTNQNWVSETIHQLQHHKIVQLFTECLDLGPKYETIKTHKGFVWSYHKQQLNGNAYEFWHPGYAWAARRDALENLGGLIETAILGAGDHHMALALIGQAKKSLPGEISKDYSDYVMRWQDRAEKHIQRDIGYVDGTLIHYWHGKKSDRKYIERWSILIKNNFKPTEDLIKDTQGLFKFNNVNPILRDQIRYYFRQRNEDSVDL